MIEMEGLTYLGIPLAESLESNLSACEAIYSKPVPYWRILVWIGCAQGVPGIVAAVSHYKPRSGTSPNPNECFHNQEDGVAAWVPRPFVLDTGPPAPSDGLKSFQCASRSRMRVPSKKSFQDILKRLARRTVQDCHTMPLSLGGRYMYPNCPITQLRELATGPREKCGW